jgi:hypothetical protein
VGRLEEAADCGSGKASASIGRRATLTIPELEQTNLAVAAWSDMRLAIASLIIHYLGWQCFPQRAFRQLPDVGV